MSIGRKVPLSWEPCCCGKDMGRLGKYWNRGWEFCLYDSIIQDEPCRWHWCSELVKSRFARIARPQFRRIAPNGEALNKNPNCELPIQSSTARLILLVGFILLVADSEWRSFVEFYVDMGSNPEIVFLNNFFWHKKRRGCRSWMALSSRQIGHHTISGNISHVSNSSEAKKGSTKIAACKFCDKTYSGCCTTRATAHILGRPVLGQTNAGIQSCITINKKDDVWRAILKNAQRALAKSCKRRKKLLLVKSESNLRWTRFLHPAP